MMNCPHCETEVDEHPAGRCLDWWVETTVLPERITSDWYRKYENWNRNHYYSTDIAAAWEVVGRAEIHTLKRVVAHEDDAPSEWLAMAYAAPELWGQDVSVMVAICRAALKAVYVGEAEK